MNTLHLVACDRASSLTAGSASPTRSEGFNNFLFAKINNMSTQYNSNLVNVQAPFKLIPTQEILKDDKYIDGDAFFQQIYPQESAPYAYELQRQATFWLDSPNCALDMLNSTIEMDVKTVAVGNTGFLDNDAHCLFARVRLLTKSGVVFEDVVGYNTKHIAEKVCSVGQEFCNTHWEDGSDNILITEASKVAVSSIATQHMEFVPDLSFIQMCKVLHLPVTGGMALELTFDDSRNVFSTISAAAALSITNLKYNMRMIPLTTDYIDKLRVAVSRGELLYNFNCVYRQVAPWNQSNNALSIQYGVKSANALLCRWYLSTDVVNGAVRYQQKSQQGLRNNYSLFIP